MLKIAILAQRGFLVLFGAVVLGLAVTLSKQQKIGSVPSETSFSIFAGAFGILAAIIGLLHVFWDKIPALVVMAIDGLACVFYLAGGIALTIALKSVSSCTSKSDEALSERFFNKILNGGCREKGGETFCFAGRDDDHPASYTTGRCQRAQADYVFQYLGFIFGLAAIATTFYLHKRGGGSTKTYV
ncbi:marvel domain-containing protein [Xylariomycetidae sp. FL0641]|nr:marvel domain-containing protein [Xylariomycetidae sp. FL0641]